MSVDAAVSGLAVLHFWVRGSWYHCQKATEKSVPAIALTIADLRAVQGDSESVHQRRNILKTSDVNLHPEVSVPVHLFGGGSSHTPFSLANDVSKERFYLLMAIHMNTWHLLDFDYKAERNKCFSFGNFGIISNSVRTQHVTPRKQG